MASQNWIFPAVAGCPPCNFAASPANRAVPMPCPGCGQTPCAGTQTGCKLPSPVPSTTTDRIRVRTGCFGSLDGVLD